MPELTLPSCEGRLELSSPLAHFVHVLNGWISFRFQGMADAVTVHATRSLCQPTGVPHNVIARSDDLELIEIDLPARYGTFYLPVRDEKAVQP